MFNRFIIYKDNIISNVKQAKQKNPNSKICAMIKANAYGVGLDQVVKILNPYVDYFGVSCFFEAKRLFKLTKKKVLIVGPICEREKINTHISYTCSSLEDVKFLISKNKKINIHLKINTGMNRYGFSNFAKFKQAVQLCLNSKLNIEGIFTHFATTDEFVEMQMKCFQKFVLHIKQSGIKAIVHADNSETSERFSHNLDMVRIGFNLYNSNTKPYLPAVEIRSQIVQIQNINKGDCVGYAKRFVAKSRMEVGIVPIGYADGFDMSYLGIKLKLKNKWCKVLNICMDCFMLDITKLRIKKEEPICVLNKINSLSHYAKHSHTHEYEVMTRFSSIRANKEVLSSVTTQHQHKK